MSRHVVKLPDLGEGTVSSEVVAWKVKVGDVIGEDQPVVEMSTDKAVVELPAPVGGKVVSLGGQPGDTIAVGGELYVLETDASVAVESAPAAAPAASNAPAKTPAAANNGTVATPPANKPSGGRVMASPATRARAKLAGIDLTTVNGSGRD
ncbi:MAG TPA: biotin/lipoyl-containing protein, partial [Steroidobacter sp.]